MSSQQTSSNLTATQVSENQFFTLSCGEHGRQSPNDGISSVHFSPFFFSCLLIYKLSLYQPEAPENDIYHP